MFCSQCDNYYSLKKFIETEDESTDTNTSGYYHCETCNYNEKIPDNTLIYKLNFQNNLLKKQPPKYSKLDIYHRISNYTCINKKCPTHKSSFKGVKQAAVIKDNNYNITYVCMECSTEKNIEK